MTVKEAAKIINECKDKGFKHTFYTLNEYHTALDMAAKALEQESCEDAISRQMALDAMYELCGEGSLKVNPWRDNLHIDAIIDEIENLPSVNLKYVPDINVGNIDCISREAAIRIASGYCHFSNIPEELKKLPSVNPEPKIGYWIEDEEQIHVERTCHCSECGCTTFVSERSNHCPDCGSKMIGEGRMTLDEAIIHAEEVAEEEEKSYHAWQECKNRGNDGWSKTDIEFVDNSIKDCRKCAEDHRQLVEWLRELKNLKERSLSDDEISREDALMALTEEWEESKDELIAKFVRWIRKLPPVYPKCEDAISRQDAIKEAKKEGSYDYISAYELSKLPPVTPKDDRQNLIDSISKLQTYKLFSGGEKLVELDDVIAILEGR